MSTASVTAEGLHEPVLEEIRRQNLGVYRAMPIRLREDVSQEAQIANDYRGRLIYELLQNADDAMTSAAGMSDRIVFRLTDDTLWVGNSGRPLDEDDIRGLCGIGASSKTLTRERRRASIGHKGMGFKSVLEMTERPSVLSETVAFELSAEEARPLIDSLMLELEEPRPERVPIMRLPTAVPLDDPYWVEQNSAGIHTLFRFPLRSDITEERWLGLADRLLNLPITSILFLKHLERVDVSVESTRITARFGWTLTRERLADAGWEQASGLDESGLYRITLETESSDGEQFLLAHNRDVEIGANRGGLDASSWANVDLAEVSLAIRLDNGRPIAIPNEWRKFHIFLPTEEPCPYPMLVNGAFVSDLSRQEIRIGEGADDYNRLLMRHVASLLRDEVIPGLRRGDASPQEIVQLLDRGVDQHGLRPSTDAAKAIYEALGAELADTPFLPSANGGSELSFREAIVPQDFGREQTGAKYRALLPEDVSWEGRRFPHADFCVTSLARIAIDHGAMGLPAEDAPSLLAGDHLDLIDFEDHPGGKVLVDPVLEVLEEMWESAGAGFGDAVRKEKLFPIGVRDGVIERVTTSNARCFYPPRALKGAVPLTGLYFLMQELCWGDLAPKARNEVLREQLLAWTGLFGIREFKFPEVMRESVLPSLTLDSAPDPTLESLDAIAAICQLSGPTPDPGRPLRYERLGSNRALFNLCRLRLPCRRNDVHDIQWVPAYRVYFGADWTGEASAENILDAITAAGSKPPDIPFLLGPAEFAGLLDRYKHLQETSEEESGTEDEVGIEEDEEAPPDQKEHERWLSFLTWIGVNRVLRLVHFHDVEDRATWLSTKDLTRPQGWAFAALPNALWGEFVSAVRLTITEPGVPYFAAVHDLEYAVELLDAATSDASSEVAAALFEHLAQNWSLLERSTRAQVALVPEGAHPGMRSKPPRPADDELQFAGDDLWVHRLRHREWCPTTHGPRLPERTWLPGQEILRRFDRQGSEAGRLLPILKVSDSLPSAKARGVALALGIRTDLTPSSFEPEDARAFLARLSELYEASARAGSLTPSDLRQVIRPAYRNIMELLPGTQGAMSPAYAAGTLSGTPLLEHDGAGHYRFTPSNEVMYADRNGTRERVGLPPDLWTFVLEATPVVRGPLTTLLGVRVLEEEIAWSPEPSDEVLDEAGMTAFRSGLSSLAPFILARVAADRHEERLAAQDRGRLRAFIENVSPVASLTVGCKLGDRLLEASVERDAFVRVEPDRAVTAFVVWESNDWPPGTREAEALATALADLLGPGYFEAFYALISAPSDERRYNLLRLAGASTDLPSIGDDEVDEGSTTSAAPLMTPGAQPDEEPAARPVASSGGTEVIKTPLFRPDELFIEDDPVRVVGLFPSTEPTARKAAGRSGGGAKNAGYGGRTDLAELDRVGMYVALTYEQRRMRTNGFASATVFNAAAPNESAVVFDVSTLEAIHAADSSSERFRRAFGRLRDLGVGEQNPGFDILTVDPAADLAGYRLIELKSSGQAARVQEMTWNEWKTARDSALRNTYYLYLVGNLRRDLGETRPFLRAIRDPFKTIWAEEKSASVVTRTVQLQVSRFQAADEVQLSVRPAPET